MDDDDLIQIDETLSEDQMQELSAIETLNINEKNTKKRYYCIGLRSAEISKYIQQTPAQFGGSRRVEHYWEDNPLKYFLQNLDLYDMWNVFNNESEIVPENPWIVLADKALKGAFKDTPVFTGLCEVMGNAIERKMKNKSKRNLKYSEEFTSFLVILGGFSTRALDLFCQNLEGRTIQSIRNSEDHLTNPDLYFENVARFKRLIDSIQYNGPVVVMTDNTKLKSRLYIHLLLDVLLDPKIKNEKAIAKDIHAYMLQISLPRFPPIAIALIPNKGNDNSKTIRQLHKKLIQEIAFQLEIHILSIGSDDWSSSLGLRPKTHKKTARNAIISGARLLTFGISSVRYDHLLTLIKQHNSIMYKNDVIKLDKQDDAAAY
ncbi:unnamed protein product [Rhizophagus irregularis]|nr:unnamed protein product [Rhizophagus irregularis]